MWNVLLQILQAILIELPCYSWPEIGTMAPAVNGQ